MPVSDEGLAPEAKEPGELESLMQRYQQSDAEAATLLVRQLSPQIFRFYLAQVRERPLAEDLLQDFWLRIHNARRTYRPGEPVLPWVYAIARRVGVDDYRRTKRVKDHEVQREQLMEIVSPEPEGKTLPNIADLVKTLPEAQRQVVLLLKVSGLSLEEVARATGTSIGAVKQKAHRAYTKLRKVFGTET
ncbi:MAG: RNA polymerase sigma factor [Bryobacteraceae bacterium]